MSRTSARNTVVGAFVLNNEATYPWTIYVHVPGSNGKHKVKFKAEFRHVTPERRLEILQEFREALRQRESAAQGSDAQDDDVSVLKDALSYERMLLDEVLIGFSGIIDMNKAEIPFNDDTKAMLLSNSWARDALLAGYHTSLQGRSAEGN